ncbi:GNAT family N-acetyltransferase [Deinococcus wulumuqiensis]
MRFASFKPASAFTRPARKNRFRRKSIFQSGTNTLGFRRLEIRCDARNERSARIPRALGYVQDALLKNDDVAADDPGQLRDTLVFSRVQ